MQKIAVGVVLLVLMVLVVRIVVEVFAENRRQMLWNYQHGVFDLSLTSGWESNKVFLRWFRDILAGKTRQSYPLPVKPWVVRRAQANPCTCPLHQRSAPS